MKLETKVPDIQATHCRISKRCRDLHGISGAFEIAVDELRKKYHHAILSNQNFDAVIQIILTVDYAQEGQ